VSLGKERGLGAGRRLKDTTKRKCLQPEGKIGTITRPSIASAGQKGARGLNPVPQKKSCRYIESTTLGGKCTRLLLLRRGRTLSKSPQLLTRRICGLIELLKSQAPVHYGFSENIRSNLRRIHQEEGGPSLWEEGAGES